MVDAGESFSDLENSRGRFVDNREKLRLLLVTVFDLDPAEFRFDLTREEVPAWDSIGVVSLAVGIKERFGYRFTSQDVLAVRGVEDIMRLLSAKGISFDN